MNKAQALFRIGVFTIIIGAAIFFANLTVTRGGSGSYCSEVSANGVHMDVTYLSSRPYEIRVIVPKNFSATLYVFNYEGIKNLTEGIKTPLIQQPIEGSQLIDFTPNRRGAYMFRLESHTPTKTRFTIDLIEQNAIRQDIQTDSIIIILTGLAITLAATTPKITKTLKTHRSKTTQAANRH